MAFPIALAAAGAGALFGIGQKISAANIDKNNPFQARTVNSLIAGNAAQAQNQARIGIAEQQYNNALNQQQQNLSNILSTASRSGRNIPLGGLLRQSNLATQQLNATDAQARQQNQRFAMQQNQILAQEQQNVRSYNIEQPYMRRMQQAADLRNAGNQNIAGAVGTTVNYGMAKQFGGIGGASGGTNAGITNFLPNQSVGNDLPPLTYNVNTQGYTPNFFSTMQRYGRQNFGLDGRLG